MVVETSRTIEIELSGNLIENAITCGTAPALYDFVTGHSQFYGGATGAEEL